MAERSNRTKPGVRALNIGEIARRAGVSRSTVSYALSGKRPLSEATRRRIHEVIDELGYRPNAHARALKEGRTRTIGLVIPPAGSSAQHSSMPDRPRAAAASAKPSWARRAQP